MMGPAVGKESSLDSVPFVLPVRDAVWGDEEVAMGVVCPWGAPKIKRGVAREEKTSERCEVVRNDVEVRSDN